MAKKDESQLDLDVEYSLFKVKLARLWYDGHTDQYIRGQVLSDDAIWQACPAHNILSEGEAISDEEAQEYALALGISI